MATNDPGRDDGNALVRATGHDVHTSGLGSGNTPIGHGLGLGHGPAIMKPIALKAKEGLDYLTSRSKSAPPIPRDQIGKRPPSQSGVQPEIGGRNNDEPITPPVKVIDEKTGGLHLDIPAPHPVNPASIPSPDPQILGSQPQTSMHESTIPQALTFGPHLAVPAPSRGTSPASLEAYLLERKRRGGSGGGAPPRVVTPSPGVKGKWFKSSPLSPTERDVTDGVKRNKGAGSAMIEDDGSVPASTTVVEGDGLS